MTVLQPITRLQRLQFPSLLPGGATQTETTAEDSSMTSEVKGCLRSLPKNKPSEILELLRSRPRRTQFRFRFRYLREAVALLELRDGVGSHVVAHLLFGLDGPLHQPLGRRHNTEPITLNGPSPAGPCEAESQSSPGEPSHLYHRENVNEVQPLDLMRLQTMRTLHLREDGHELLCQRSGEQRTSAIGPFQFRLDSDWLKQKTEGWAFGGLQEQSELTFSGRWWSFLGREDPRRCQNYRW